MPIFDPASWADTIDGWSVIDAAVMDASRTFFVLRETSPSDESVLPRTRMLFVRANRDIDSGRFIRAKLGHFGAAEIAFAPGPQLEFVAVDTRQQVYSYSADRAGLEPDIPGEIPGTDLASTVRTVARVGRTLYAIGWPRRVFRRTGFEAWSLASADIPLPPHLGRDDAGGIEALRGFAFHAIAGASETDLIVVGDGGEVWSHDGRAWTRCRFPDPEGLRAAACAEDGGYCVISETGRVWRGRDDEWRPCGRPPYPLAPKDCAWFDGRLWIGADDGLWILQGDQLVAAPVPPDIGRVGDRIDVSPDGMRMLVAGRGGAAVLDSVRWEMLFSGYGADG